MAQRAIYHERYAGQMTTLLCEAVAFPTEAGNAEAVAKQAAWLAEKAKQLGLTWRDAGPVTEVELPGPAGAPVLGLVVHGDVQPPGDSGWTSPPYTCAVRDGAVWGRGTADDKGPLVQALLAMAALRDSKVARTHTIRLLVGSDEESGSRDITAYLKTHKAPELSLVLDSEFPVVVGEKAWDGLTLTAADAYRVRKKLPPQWTVTGLEAGIGASIVPPRAVARLRGGGLALCPAKMPAGYACSTARERDETVMTVLGRAAHSGMNIEGGRNALVMLAGLLYDKVAECGARDLLEFAMMAGKDLHGAGLGLTQHDAVWGRYDVNVGVMKAEGEGGLKMTVNLRRIPPKTGKEMEAYLAKIVTEFNRTHGAALVAGGFFGDEPLVFDPQSKIVKRLLAVYQKATGKAAKPAISGGGTYAKRLPNSIAFGMWFPGKPYPGHDVDEHVAVADLHRGVDVLLEALVDLGCGAPIAGAFGR